MKIDESEWVDLSNNADRDAGVSRYVKVLGVEGGFGRTIRIEAIG
jgi:hypothetical protein